MEKQLLVKSKPPSLSKASLLLLISACTITLLYAVSWPFADIVILTCFYLMLTAVLVWQYQKQYSPATFRLTFDGYNMMIWQQFSQHSASVKGYQVVDYSISARGTTIVARNIGQNTSKNEFDVTVEAFGKTSVRLLNAFLSGPDGVDLKNWEDNITDPATQLRFQEENDVEIASLAFHPTRVPPAVSGITLQILLLASAFWLTQNHMPAKAGAITSNTEATTIPKPVVKNSVDMRRIKALSADELVHEPAEEASDNTDDPSSSSLPEII